MRDGLCCLRTRFRSENERSGHVGAQRTRSKCRRRFTVLSQHNASPPAGTSLRQFCRNGQPLGKLGTPGGQQHEQTGLAPSSDGFQSGFPLRRLDIMKKRRNSRMPVTMAIKAKKAVADMQSLFSFYKSFLIASSPQTRSLTVRPEAGSSLPAASLFPQMSAASDLRC